MDDSDIPTIGHAVERLGKYFDDTARAPIFGTYRIDVDITAKNPAFILKFMAPGHAFENYMRAISDHDGFPCNDITEIPMLPTASAGDWVSEVRAHCRIAPEMRPFASSQPTIDRFAGEIASWNAFVKQFGFVGDLNANVQTLDGFIVVASKVWDDGVLSSALNGAHIELERDRVERDAFTGDVTVYVRCLPPP